MTALLDTYTVLRVAEKLREEALTWRAADGDAAEWIGWSASYVETLLVNEGDES